MIYYNIYIIFILLLLYPMRYIYPCPNNCNNNGQCIGNICQCFQQFTGVDCSQRICPSNNAWSLIPYEDNNINIHTQDLYECSNMGYCDREIGECVCRDGFTGDSCQRKLCPSNLNNNNENEECSGHGRCMSLSNIALEQDYLSLTRSLEYTDWDADMIHGCICDEGYTSHDCSKKTCISHIDPININGNEINEKHILDCTCEEPCDGSLILSYENTLTYPIPYDADITLLQHYIDMLFTYINIDVSFINNDQLCSNNGTITTFTYKYHGDISPMIVYNQLESNGNINVSIHMNGDSSTLDQSIKSQNTTYNTLYKECNQRGQCNETNGECICYDGFTSSDGYGNEGNLNDCGYIPSYLINSYTNCSNVKSIYTSGSIKEQCNGVGNCTSDLICDCPDGYSGPACEYRTCPSSIPWINDININNIIHTKNTFKECSNGGTCDKSTGICNCENDIFNGDACEVLDCADDCTNGTCFTLYQLGKYNLNKYGIITPITYTEPWDAYKIKGCQCLQKETNSISLNNNTYRGPYSFSSTSWKGYNCKQSYCPKGDNVLTYGVNEIQRINCTLSNSNLLDGQFQLIYKEESTSYISYNTSSTQLTTILNNLAFIYDINVQYYGGKGICNDTDYIDIEFRNEYGEIPLLELNTNTNTFTSNDIFNITRIQKNTKEELECSSLGICNEWTGICNCIDGYTSSNGQEQYGHRGDCSFNNPWKLI